MPILNWKIQGPSGVPIPEAFRDHGPRLQVVLAKLDQQVRGTKPEGATTQRSSGSRPHSVAGLALVDTGASRTSIDRTVATGLGLPVVGAGIIHSATQQDIQVPLFAGKIVVPDQQGSLEITTLQAYGVNIQNQGLIALIGRDLLASCTLFYNGREASFSLSF